LTRVAPPTIGVVLNVGLAHVGLLGSIEAVAAAKRELVEGLAGGGLAVLNADDPRVRAMSSVARRFTLYGLSNDAAVRAERIRLHGLEGSTFTLLTPRGKAEVYLRLPGHHSVSNALAVAAVALEFEFDAPAIASALHGFRPPSRRLNIVSGRNGSTVIDDSYNASPGSMQAALEVLRLAPRGALKIAVLGDMLELGDHAERAHEEIGSLGGKTADIVIAVGDRSTRPRPDGPGDSRGRPGGAPGQSRHPNRGRTGLPARGAGALSDRRPVGGGRLRPDRSLPGRRPRLRR